MIRKAEPHEHGKLTEISFASKRYWDYPSEYFTTWQNELTITIDYVKNHNVYIYERDSLIIAYYSVIKNTHNCRIGEIDFVAGFWLDHMFVLPQFMGESIGTKMFSHCVSICSTPSEQHIPPLLHILADPHAVGFYIKLGCTFIGEYPSSIYARTTPYLQYNLNKEGDNPV